MTSKEFETLTSRIIEHLVESGAKVILNDRIPDPDNPKQLRQIDITLSRNCLKTHIECRNHKAPQDAKWIEELIGRKISLNASAMMAVSSSGFTAGAILKAERFGVFLHDLTKFSPDQVTTWGNHSIVEFGYFGLHPLQIQLIIPTFRQTDLNATANELQDRQDYVDAMLNPLKYRFNENYRDFNHPYSFNITAEAHNMTLQGKQVKEARIRGTVYFFKRRLLLPTVMEFRQASHNRETMAHVESAENANTQIIKAGTKASIKIDMSNAPQPEPNSMLAGVIEVELNRPTQIPEFKIIGSPDHKIDIANAEFSVACF